MKKKVVFIIIAILALLVQIANPMWWIFVWGGSLFGLFLIGMIVEGDFFSYYPTDFPTAFFVGIFSIYGVIALIAPIWSFFSAKGMDSEQIYAKKKNIVFLTINILTIIISVSFLAWAIFTKPAFP